VKKAMKAWRIPPEFWIAIEKIINHYAAHPLKRDKEDIPPEPQKPFGTTFYTPRNVLQVASWKQSHVGWENFLKGRMCTEWCTYIKHHLTSINIKKDYQEWSTKLILSLWDHIYRVWMSRIIRDGWRATSKRPWQEEWTSFGQKNELRYRLHEFQLTHLNERDKITNLHYESKWCWANLSELYL
jgi:hypothetical protein